MTAPPHTLVRRAVEDIWNRGQLDVADELFAPNYVNHGGLITDLVRGPEAIKTSVVFYRRAFPELHITIDDVASAEGMTMLSWRARGARPGALANTNTDADTDGFRGTTRTRADDGQIQESWTEWDQAEALRRLGMRMGIVDRAEPDTGSATDGWDTEGGASSVGG